MMGGLKNYLHMQFRVNVCPYQGSRTIRTEEAVMISLAKLSPHLAANEASGNEKPKSKTEEKGAAVVDFSNDAVSDESSDSGSESSSDSESD